MIIILNGPAGCGKDTIADMLRDEHGFFKTCFKHDLYVEAAKCYGLPVAEVISRNEDRDLKETPWVKGKSVRQMLVHTSENVVKPAHGRDYFGKLARGRCEGVEENIVFSDGGFEEEVACLPGAVVVRLRRHGFTFKGDSRTYLYPHRSGDVLLVGGEVRKGVRDVLAVALLATSL